MCLFACTAATEETLACTTDGQVLNLGFYAFFAPVSHSASDDPASADFRAHQGYEADLLTALETMEGAGLKFARKPIQAWDDIWLLSSKPEYDIVGGGITILDKRTKNAAGEEVVAFTSGHIAFRQSLLVRSEDADRINDYDKLNKDVLVGALADTTGEARLLVLTGIADADGVLAAGTRIQTAQGEIVADGSADYFISASSESPNLQGRRRLYPPSPSNDMDDNMDDMPQVIYLGDTAGEQELLDALSAGEIDALARGELGNRDAAHASGGAFTVTALDSEFELGGFTLSADNADLLACIDEKINYLTDERRIGYGEWRADPSIFIQRARMWTSDK